jgi:hypothetical protein
VIIRLGLAHADPIGPDLGGSSPEASALRAKTCAADLVIVAQLGADHQSTFSDDGSSIFTLRRFAVRQVLRPSSIVPSVPTEISVSMLGGTVVVNGHKITVRQPAVADLATGTTYMLFLKTIPGSNAFQAFPHSVYELNDGKLVPIIPSKVFTLTARDAQSEISAVAAACPPGEGVGSLEH